MQRHCCSPFCRPLAWPRMAAFASAAADANGFCAATAGAAKPITLACGWLTPARCIAGLHSGGLGTSLAACVSTGGAMAPALKSVSLSTLASELLKAVRR